MFSWKNKYYTWNEFQKFEIYLGSKLSESEIFFWDINSSKIVKKFRWMCFFFLHLVRSKGPKGSSVQVPNMSGKIFRQRCLLPISEKSINSIASVKLWSESFKSCLRLRDKIYIMNCCYSYCWISFISGSQIVRWSIVLKSKVSILPFH